MKKYRLIFCLAMVIVSLLVVMGGSVQAATPPDTNVNSVAVQMRTPVRNDGVTV